METLAKPVLRLVARHEAIRGNEGHNLCCRRITISQNPDYEITSKNIMFLEVIAADACLKVLLEIFFDLHE
jgi:hypothetical protein